MATNADAGTPASATVPEDERDVLRQLVERAPLAVGYVDTGLVYRFANESAAAIVGLPTTEIIGRGLGEVIGEDTDAYHAVLEARESDQPVQRVISYKAPREGGRSGAFLSVYLPEHADDGSIRGVLLLGIDVSTSVLERLNVERELGEKVMLLHAVLENSPAAIYVKDADSRFLLSNQRAAQLLNSTPEEMIGKRDEEFIPTDLAHEIYAHDREVMRTGIREEYEEVIPSNDGLLVFASLKFPVVDSDDVPLGVGGISTDITERKRAEQEREFAFQQVRNERRQLAAVLRGLAEGVVISDARGNVLDMNEQALRMHGFNDVEQARSRVYSLDEMDLHEPDGTPLPVERWPLKRAVNGESFDDMHVRVRNRATGDEERYWSYSGVPVFNERGTDVVLAVLTIRDVTNTVNDRAALVERERLSAGLNQVNAVLYRAGDRDETLQAALDEAVHRLGADLGSIVMLEGREWYFRCASGYLEGPSAARLPYLDSPLRIQAAVTRRPVFIEDVEAAESLRPDMVAHESGSRGMSAAPLIVAGKVEGVLGLHYQRPHPFSQPERDFIASLASSFSLWLENVWLRDAEVAAKEEAQLELDTARQLLRSSRALARWTDLNEMLSALAGVLFESVDHGRVWIYRFFEENQEGELVAVSGAPFMELGSRVRLADLSPQTQAVALATEPQIIDYDAIPPEQRGPGEEESARVALLAPIIQRGRMMGAIGVDNPDERSEFSRREIDLVEGVAAQAAIAIENAALYQAEVAAREELHRAVTQLAEANHELEAIASVTDVAIATLDLQTLLDALLRKLAQHMGADAAIVLLREGERLRTKAAFGLEEDAQAGFEVAIGEGFAGRIAERREALYAEDIQSGTLVKSAGIRSLGIRTMLGTPLQIGRELLGVLHIDWRSVHPEDPRELRLIRLTADRVSLAIRNAQIYEERIEAGRLSQALTEIDAEINSTLDFDEIMRRVVARATQALHAESGIVFIKEGSGLRARYSHNAPTYVQNRWYPRSVMRYSMLAESRPGTIVVDNDVRSNPAYDSIFAGMVGASSLLNVVLRSGDETIGNLGFFNTSPSAEFNERHVDFLRNLAASLQLAVRNATLYAEERQVADTLQRALLKTPEQIEGLEFDCLYRSATEIASVGGDFYDLFNLPDGRLGVLIGDVSGKGLTASTLTSLVRNTIVAYSYELDSPAAVVERTNRVVFDAVPSEMFMTLVFGMLDPANGHLVYCNAGHPAAVVLRNGICSQTLDATSPLVGAFRDFTFTNAEVRVDEHDTILLYTDGVIEARGPGGMFGEDRLCEVAEAEARDGEPGGLPDRIYRRLLEFTGGSTSDDIAMLAFSLSRSPAAPSG